MKRIWILLILPLLLSSCFSTAINEGRVKKIDNNTYETTYENYWRAPWSKEDITETARSISINNCKDKGMEFAMKSHSYNNPDINIIYSCIDYDDKSFEAEKLRRGSETAISKLEEFSIKKERERQEKSDKLIKVVTSVLNAAASGYSQANQNMLDSIDSRQGYTANYGYNSFTPINSSSVENSRSTTNSCRCIGYSGVGGPCYDGVGGPAYSGVGGPAYSGVGGPCYAGVGGPEYSGVGGPAYDGVGGPRYNGVGGPAYDGVGGPAYSGVGGPCYTGVGGPCYAGVGGGWNCPSVCKY